MLWCFIRYVPETCADIMCCSFLNQVFRSQLPISTSLVGLCTRLVSFASNLFHGKYQVLMARPKKNIDNLLLCELRKRNIFHVIPLVLSYLNPASWLQTSANLFWCSWQNSLSKSDLLCSFRYLLAQPFFELCTLANGMPSSTCDARFLFFLPSDINFTRESAAYFRTNLSFAAL